MKIDRNGNDEAHFSNCRKYRYLLRRQISDRTGAPRVITFCMLNPATADAFVNDHTITRCIRFAQRWRGDVLEVVNLFARRTPHPAELKRASRRGDDECNDAMILLAARRSARFVCAWGNHGALDDRDQIVSELLVGAGVTRHHFGLSGEGHPIHPSARGIHTIPYERVPTRMLSLERPRAARSPV